AHRAWHWVNVMASLLFLAHRIPYPPDKGEKIRAYHALRRLASRFDVHLGCFIDDREDEQYLPQLVDICASVNALPLNRKRGLLRGLRGMTLGSSFSEYFFRDAKLARWIAETLAVAHPHGIFVYSSAMAPYAMPYAASHRVVLDMVDVDSEKWRA